MVFVRVDQHFERFAGFDQPFDHFVTVLDVHVVVSGTVRQQQFPLQQVRETDRAVVVVPRRIVLRQAVIKFGVDRVVIAP